MSRRGPRSSSILLVALGALTGLAVGAVIADRLGGLDGLLKPKSGRLRKRKAGELDHDEMAIAAAADSADHEQDYADHADAVSSPYADDDSIAVAAGDDDRGERGVPDETELEERVLEAFWRNAPLISAP